MVIVMVMVVLMVMLIVCLRLVCASPLSTLALVLAAVPVDSRTIRRPDVKILVFFVIHNASTKVSTEILIKSQGCLSLVLSENVQNNI